MGLISHFLERKLRPGSVVRSTQNLIVSGYPGLILSLSYLIFQSSTSFNRDAVKAGTGRRFLGGLLDHTSYCYTLEVSFYSYIVGGTTAAVPYTEEACILGKALPGPGPVSSRQENPSLPGLTSRSEIRIPAQRKARPEGRVEAAALACPICPAFHMPFTWTSPNCLFQTQVFLVCVCWGVLDPGTS